MYKYYREPDSISLLVCSRNLKTPDSVRSTHHLLIVRVSCDRKVGDCLYTPIIKEKVLVYDFLTLFVLI